MAKKVKLKDRLGNQILPITRATTVEMNDGTNMQEKLDSIEDNILEVNYNSGNTALVFGSSSVKYTITIMGSDTNKLSNISVDGASKTVSDFPLEGNTINFTARESVMVSIEMEGNDITSNTDYVTSTSEFPYRTWIISNITNDITIFAESQSG